MSENEFRIAAVGDISLGDHPVCVGHGMRAKCKRYGHELLRHVKSYFLKADVAFANLETVASDVGLNRRLLSSYEMRGNPDSLLLLKEAGINVLNIANNHSMQHGIEAFRDTVINLTGLGLSVVGLDDANRDAQTVTFRKGEEEFVFYSISMRPEEWYEGQPPYSLRKSPTEVLEEVRALRARTTGRIICSIHWGLEFINYPSEEQVDLAHKLVDSGVSVVLGHHAHVLQKVEQYKSGLIFYSLGNFLFDLWQESTKDSVIVEIRFRKGVQKPDYNLVPVLIGRDCIPRVAKGADASRILSAIEYPETGAPQSDPDSREQDYDRIYYREYIKFRYSSYLYFIRNIYRYPLSYLIQSLLRTAGRRLTGK